MKTGITDRIEQNQNNDNEIKKGGIYIQTTRNKRRGENVEKKESEAIHKKEGSIYGNFNGHADRTL